MSKATKRKHVTKEVMEEYYVPEQDEKIVKIITGRGNNLHEVISPDGDQYLVSMPTKFRKNVWVKRGDFVVVSPIKEGVKVQGEIVYILYNKQIKYLKEESLWPKAFGEDKKEEKEDYPPLHKDDRNISNSDDSNSQDDEDDDLFTNPNHRPTIYHQDSDESSSDDDLENESEIDERDEDNNVISDTSSLMTEKLNEVEFSSN